MALETDNVDEEVEFDPTEPIPVIRHHLHEILLLVNDAGTLVGALDLADQQRGLRRDDSPFSRRLARSERLIAGYLGLLDEEDDEDE